MFTGTEEAEPINGRLLNAFYGPYRSFPPVVDILEHNINAVFKGNPWFPTQEPVNLGGVGKGAVRLAGPFRDIGNFSPQQFDQPVNAVSLTGTDIHRLAGNV